MLQQRLQPESSATAPQPPRASGPCQLGTKAGQIKHVIYLQFDNTHYRRDRANVASDLEQMPHLLNFLKGNGTLLTNDHTILISHTAGGILASLTGLYPDRNGQTVSNSYDYFKNDGTPQFTSSFKYWTDTVDGTNETMPNMVGDGGQTTPAPWLTYTHAGCNVGGVSSANIVLENNSTTASGDMTRVFGVGSDEWNEAANPATRTKSLADFVGIAVHCAKGNALCEANPKAKPDDSTIYPGSDDGYKALFGAKYVNPAITGGQPCVKATDGTDITDPAGNCGFPGFDGALAKNTLGMVAQMQENGVPVTFAYISDAHDNHTLARASGPGEADYKQQLADYDAAFATFFQRLASHGIDKSNTLFVVTVDEGDHFAGGVGTPQADGSLAYSHTPCSPTVATCPANQIGEVDGEPEGVRAGRQPVVRPALRRRTDDLRAGPARRGTILRCATSSGGSAAASAFDPYVNASVPLAQRLADTVEEQTLHMVNADPKRTPTFTFFGNSDFFFQASNPTACGTPDAADVCRPEVRLEPRRLPGRDRQHVARDGRSRRRAERRRLEDLDGSRRHQADDQLARRAIGLVRGRRPCDHAGPRQGTRRRARRRAGNAARRRLQAAERAVRLVRARHARRVDRGDPVDRRAEVRLDRDADREPDRQA